MKPAAARLLGIFAGLLLLVGSIVVYSSLLVPKYEEIQQLRGERHTLDAVLAEEQQAVNAVKQLLSQYSSVASLRDSLAVTLPGQEEVADIVNQLQGIAASNGMLMESLSMKPLAISTRNADSIVQPIGTLRIHAELIGDYAGLRAYLAALETNVRIMDIELLEITGAGTGNGPYRYDIEIDTYYQT